MCMYFCIAMYAQDDKVRKNWNTDINNQFESNDELFFLSDPYPNPVKFSANIYYKLPVGVLEGFIVVYNILGNEVVRIKVDKSNVPVNIRANDYGSGTYFYQLEYSNMKSPTKANSDKVKHFLSFITVNYNYKLALN